MLLIMPHILRDIQQTLFSFFFFFGEEESGRVCLESASSPPQSD